MSKQHFPAGWDEARVQRLIDHYEAMSDDELVAEDEAAHKAGKNNLPVPGAETKNNGVNGKGSRRKKNAVIPKGTPKRTKNKGDK